MGKLNPSKWISIWFLAVFLGLTTWSRGACAYDSITNRGNNVTVDVQPIQLAPGKPVTFKIRMNTHSVDLVQDLMAVSTLQDDQGNKYPPSKWQGSPPGGHHRQGTLFFPSLGSGVKSVKLVIREVAGVPERTFEWNSVR